MALSAEQNEALSDAELTPDATEAVHEDAPAEDAKPVEKEPIREGILDDAETPAEAEPEGEPKADDKPADAADPEKGKAWKAVEAAKKEQVKVARARQELGREVERVQDFARTLEAREQTIAQREARVSRLESALQSRDLGALVELGFDYDGYTRQWMERQSPDAAAKAALDEARKLREEIAERDRKAEQQALSQAQVQETRRVAQQLVEIVDEEPTECPELFAWAPERIAQEGIALRDQIFRETRRMPTYAVVIERLQAKARAEASVAKEREARLRQRSSGQTSDAGSAGKVDPKAGSGGPNVPALTSRTAGVRATPPRELTEEELDAELKAEIRATFGGRK